MRWAVEFLEKVIKTRTFSSHRLHEIIPDAICRDGVSLLTQVKTIHAQHCHVRLLVILIINTRVLEEWLENDGEVVTVKFRHKTHSLHNVDEFALHFAKLLEIFVKFSAKNAAAFNGSGELTRNWS